MLPFGQMTYHSQIYYLRRLALVALRNYSFANVKINLLNHGENTSFKVLAKVRTNKKWQPFVLRIHRNNYHSNAGIRSELHWLDRLSKETKLVVPEPVAGTNGNLLQHAKLDGVLETRCCVL